LSFKSSKKNVYEERVVCRGLSPERKGKGKERKTKQKRGWGGIYGEGGSLTELPRREEEATRRGTEGGGINILKLGRKDVLEEKGVAGTGISSMGYGPLDSWSKISVRGIEKKSVRGNGPNRDKRQKGRRG